MSYISANSGQAAIDENINMHRSGDKFVGTISSAIGNLNFTADLKFGQDPNISIYPSEEVMTEYAKKLITEKYDADKNSLAPNKWPPYGMSLRPVDLKMMNAEGNHWVGTFKAEVMMGQSSIFMQGSGTTFSVSCDWNDKTLAAKCEWHP